MQNVGEEIVGEWLRHVCGCSFVQYNLHTPSGQGEIDVIGIEPHERRLYVCEVCVHLTTGLQYVRDRRPDNVARFLAKFEKDIAFARSHFRDYDHHFMLWSPIVKKRSNPIYDQIGHVAEVRRALAAKFDVDLQLVVNHRFRECLDELRAIARRETKELRSPILRLMQIEEYLRRLPNDDDLDD